MVITIHTGVGVVTTIRIGVMLMADIIHIMADIIHTTVEDIMQEITITTEAVHTIAIMAVTMAAGEP